MDIILNEEVDKNLYDLFYRATALILEKKSIGIDSVEISVEFVNEEIIQNLNKSYRGKDSVTDVLSFPQFTTVEEIKKSLNLYGKNMELPLGDVVMCLEKIQEQAKEFNHSEELETLYLFIHSVLHLLGYDHEDEEDKKVMRNFEKEIIKEMDL